VFHYGYMSFSLFLVSISVSLWLHVIPTFLQAEKEEDIVEQVVELQEKVKTGLDGLEDSMSLQKHINFVSVYTFVFFNT